MHRQPLPIGSTKTSPFSAGCSSTPEIKIEGFRPVWNEVVFLDADSGGDEEFEPLLGYVILEQAQAAVDMVGHRLVPVPNIDMKQMQGLDRAFYIDNAFRP